jgi:curli biogenesis system outer membrane secretion channel CsgG
MNSLIRKLLIISVLILVTGLAGSPVWGVDNLFKIAVLPFDDGSIQDHWWGNSLNLGKGVSDELVTALLNTDKFRLIEREQIDSVLREQKIGASGLVDAQSAAAIGKILGVQYLVIGRVTEFTNSSNTFSGGNNKAGLAVVSSTARVAIDARMVDTSSAEIIFSVTGVGEKTNTNLGFVDSKGGLLLGSSEFKKTNLGRALRDAITQVATKLGNKAYNGKFIKMPTIGGLVVLADPNRGIYINVGVGDGAKEGMVFIVHRVVDEIKDPQTGDVLDVVSEKIAEITVTEVKEKISICTVSTKLNETLGVAVGDKVEQKIEPKEEPKEEPKTEKGKKKGKKK